MLSIMAFLMLFSTFFSLLHYLSYLAPLHSPILPEMPETMITTQLLGATLKKFPYHHMPLEVLIVQNLLILDVQNNNFLALKGDSAKS